MMDRLAAMSVFVTVAESGSLSAAARRLGVPLTTVSRRMADLEAHLQARLFRRTSRRLTLTDAGQAYLAAVRRLLEDLGAAERAAAGEYAVPRGLLVLTAPVVFGRTHLLPVIATFLREYPQIDLRLMLTDRLVHIVDDQVDLALRIGTLPDSGLVAVRLGEVRWVICASPEYLAAHGEPLAPDALAAHDCIAFETIAPGGEWVFGRGADTLRVAIAPRLSVSTAEAAIDAAVAGLGITRVLSYQVEAQVRAGSLRLVLDAQAPDPWPVHLVHAGQGIVAQKLRVFLDFAVPRLRARLAALVI